MSPHQHTAITTLLLVSSLVILLSQTLKDVLPFTLWSPLSSHEGTVTYRWCDNLNNTFLLPLLLSHLVVSAIADETFPPIGVILKLSLSSYF